MGSSPLIGDADAADSAPSVRLIDLATLGFTFFAVGVTVSVALVERGATTSQVIGAALVVYSATSELAYIAVRDSGGGAAAGVISGWLVATRFGLLCVSLGTRLRGSTWERVAAAALAVDPSVAMAVQEPAGQVRRTYWRATGTLVGGWLLGTVAGVLLGNVVADANRWGLDAVFPAALLAIVGNLLRRREGLVAAVVGAGLCLVLLPIAPGGVPILASVLGAVAGVSVARRRPSISVGRSPS